MKHPMWTSTNTNFVSALVGAISIDIFTDFYWYFHWFLLIFSLISIDFHWFFYWFSLISIDFHWDFIETSWCSVETSWFPIEKPWFSRCLSFELSVPCWGRLRLRIHRRFHSRGWRGTGSDGCRYDVIVQHVAALGWRPAGSDWGSTQSYHV